jgi:hypothetical protein
MSSTELRYLDPRALTFSRNGVHLRLTIEGERSFPRVSVVRAFPLTDPTHWLSVRFGAEEAGVIVDLAQLEAESRRLVMESLKGRYLVARIRRIHAVKERLGTLEWDVETDRGRCRFTTRSLRKSTSSPSPDRYLLSDVDGNRFDVPELSTLDAASRAFMLRHL